MQKIFEIISRWSSEGIRFPMAYDANKKKPSATLFFLYISFILVLVSAIALHFHPTLVIATVTCITIWVLAFVFYKMRAINSFKADLDDHSIELTSEKEKSNK